MKCLRFSSGFLLTILLLADSAPVAAYELITHAQISQRAFDGSLGLAGYLEDVGVQASDVFDPASARGFTDFAGFENTGTPRNWFAAGSIREDDYKRHVGSEIFGCDPAQNPEYPPA